MFSPEKLINEMHTYTCKVINAFKLTRGANPFTTYMLSNYYNVYFKYPTILYFNKGEIQKRKAKQGKGKHSWKVLFRKDGQEVLSM